MAIQVTCPSCLKRFQVSDKFAGKTGPCPSCKKPIRVPDKTEEVVIHAPEDDAPKDSTGQSILKPIVRQETDVTRRGLFITLGAVLAAVVVAIGMRWLPETPIWVQAIGVILLAPPLVWAGYSFIRDQELEPFTGEDLRTRVLMLSGILAALWLIYAFAPTYVLDLDTVAELPFMAAGITFLVMLGIGAFASATIFEVEPTSGLAHAGLYLIAMALLAVIAGVPLAAY